MTTVYQHNGPLETLKFRSVTYKRKPKTIIGELIRWVIVVGLAGTVIYFDVINNTNIGLMLVHLAMVAVVSKFVISMRSLEETSGEAWIDFYTDHIEIVKPTYIYSETENKRETYTFRLNDIKRITYDKDSSNLYIYGAYKWISVEERKHRKEKIRGGKEEDSSFVVIEAKYAYRDGVDFANMFFKYCCRVIEEELDY